MAGSARNAAIDWIRALSIVWIVGIWHLTGYSPGWRAANVAIFYRVTITALGLFTLLSGFLLGRSRIEPSLASFGAFWRRRMIRVYPPYLAAVLVFLVFHLLHAPAIRAVLLVSMLAQPAPTTLWFMTMIVLFYAIAPVLVLLLDRPIAFTAMSALTWSALYADWSLTGTVDPRILVYFPVFVVGMALARYPVRASPGPIVLAVAAAAIGYALSLRAIGEPDHSIWALPLALTAPIALFWLCDGRLPRSAAIERVSYGAFFLYLFHRPIYQAIIKLAHLGDGLERVIVLLAIGFPAALAFGIVAQSAYDRLLAAVDRRRLRVISVP